VEPHYEVVWPLGRQVGAQKGLSPRPQSLDGRTIGFVWDHIFKGDQMFEVVKSQLASAYDDVRFVDYPAFGNIHGTNTEERSSSASLPQRARELNVDAVVVGVGA
jgi:hypothetical protein